MINKVYAQSVVNGHTYSRQPLAAGQKFLDQMSSRSGHHVNEHEVRGEMIPEIISLEERNEKFLIVNGFGKRIVGGTIGSLFTNVIQFIDKASLVEIPNTNGESFQIVDVNEKPITNFIDPSDKPITTTKLSDGYAIQLLAEDGITPISINFGWTINNLTGIVHFAPEFKPGSANWENKKFGKPVIEGFIYIGKYTSDNLRKVSSDIRTTQENLEDAINNSIAIQPFKFSTDQMEKIGECYPKELLPLAGGRYEMYQRMTFVVPGYCFELTALDIDETIITEMRHLPNGDTQIFMDIPWDPVYQEPIFTWSNEYPDYQLTKVGAKGKYKFIATTFVKNNGKKIDVKDLIDFDNEGFEGFNLDPYEYMTELDDLWTSPSPDGLLECGPRNAQSDSSVNVNINLN